jgi:plasmid stability protein
MTDILIRNVPDDVVAGIDAQAAALGLSRVEFVRRQLLREALRVRRPVTWDELKESGKRFRDLLDEDLMERAWR